MDGLMDGHRPLGYVAQQPKCTAFAVTTVVFEFVRLELSHFKLVHLELKCIHLELKILQNNFSMTFPFGCPCWDARLNNRFCRYEARLLKLSLIRFVCDRFEIILPEKKTQFFEINF